MNLANAHNKIITLMSLFVQENKSSISMGKTDFSKLSETILIPIFTEIYGYKNLKNLNNTERMNFPGIDLADDIRRIAYQITATSGIEKIKESLDTFISHRLYERYDRLIFFIVTEKQKTYSGRGFAKIIDGKLSFNKDKDIQDYTTLLTDISALQIERLEKIVKVLEANIEPARTLQIVHQLPSAPRDFSGREIELEELENKIKRDNCSIVDIHGMGGVGKTALALALAERLTPDYPDGQIYLDLKGIDQEPRSTEEVMRHVISSYNNNTQQINTSDVGASYYSILRGKRSLLLMDNAADVKQIEPLIPPRDCLLLLTSRKHLAVPGSFSKFLEILSPPDAIKFLLKIAPRIGNQADAIAKQCGYLPFALRFAANRLAMGTLSPEDYSEKLAEKLGRERLELIEASISLSYELLEDEDKRWWRLLANFPEAFTRSDASLLWKLDKETTQKKLDKFFSFSLIEWNITDKQYHLHDLVRVYAYKKMSNEERIPEPKQFGGFLSKIHVMEGYSRGVLQVIAALAGVNLKFSNGFDYGIDGSFHLIKSLRGILVESGFPVDFTVKSSINWTASKGNIFFYLNSQTYNKIVDRNNSKRAVPIILVVACFPEDDFDRLVYREDSINLRVNFYWIVLKGPLTNNNSSKILTIPKTQRLTPESLITLLDRVQEDFFDL